MSPKTNTNWRIAVRHCFEIQNNRIYKILSPKSINFPYFSLKGANYDNEISFYLLFSIGTGWSFGHLASRFLTTRKQEDWRSGRDSKTRHSTREWPRACVKVFQPRRCRPRCRILNSLISLATLVYRIWSFLSPYASVHSRSDDHGGVRWPLKF